MTLPDIVWGELFARMMLEIDSDATKGRKKLLEEGM